MFQELMPLLAQQTLLRMVWRVGADGIRIYVIPQRVKSAGADQNDALITPLSIGGMLRELDEVWPAQLVEFVGAHLGLSSTLKRAKERMDAGAKAAGEAARKSTVGKAGTSPTKSALPPENVASEAAALTTVPDPAPPEQLSGRLFSDAPAGEP